MANRVTKISAVLMSLLFIASDLMAQGFQQANPQEIALYPQQNQFRNTMNLSGIWKFKKDVEGMGESEEWFNGLKGAQSMAVPGSWNDQLMDDRNYLGLTWYETEAVVPKSWKDSRIFVRVGSAVYAAKVWINGIPIGLHEGGHLPFSFEINKMIKYGERNRITIQVENLMRADRIPTGDISDAALRNYPDANYDFFPYSGLHRAVWLYTKPKRASIEDLTFTTGYDEATGLLGVKVEKKGDAQKGRVIVSDGDKEIETAFAFKGDVAHVNVKIPQVKLWSTDHPYLYEVTVQIGNGSSWSDVYTANAGIRTIKVTENEILLNGKPVYLKGFGRHEDFAIFGRGAAQPVMVKDYALMKWVGANSYRTSHYPYDEEFYNMADREGFLIIGETPAVGLLFYDNDGNIAKRKAACERLLTEMITRDKNHPSVIMWSVANEPMAKRKSGGVYTGEAKNAAEEENRDALNTLGGLVKLAKQLDATRPVSFAGVMGGPVEWLKIVDVLCVNRYYGWYTHTGDFDSAIRYFSKELDSLHNRYKKPIILTEFGADAISGMHSDEPEMYSEEFQVKLVKAYLDVANTKNYISGMHIWNFADFRTGQALIRQGGMNYKGVFTRDRKPKMAAHLLRWRWAQGHTDGIY